MLATRAAIAPGSAVFLGGAAILFALYVAAPSLETAYTDRLVRTRVAEVLAAIRPLQRQIEEWWEISDSLPVAPDYEVLGSRRGAEFLAAVNVSPANGRLRLALGPLIPELSGRSILLAPALDLREHLRWICVPVDIPARYLPEKCRQG